MIINDHFIGVELSGMLGISKAIHENWFCSELQVPVCCLDSPKRSTSNLNLIFSSLYTFFRLISTVTSNHSFSLLRLFSLLWLLSQDNFYDKICNNFYYGHQVIMVIRVIIVISILTHQGHITKVLRRYHHSPGSHQSSWVMLTDPPFQSPTSLLERLVTQKKRRKKL